MKKMTVLLILALLVQIAHAANVIWDAFDASDASVWDARNTWSIANRHLDIPVLYIALEDAYFWDGVKDVLGVTVSASPYFGSSWKGARAKLMNPGDVVEATSFSTGPYLYESHVGTYDISSDYSFKVAFDEIFYLGIANDAWIGENSQDAEVYGWVALAAEPTSDGLFFQSLRVIGSAFDADGGGMIVGAGAVPEPSSTILLLLGIAGIALRRKSTATRP